MNAFAGIGAELFTPVIIEGGSSFDEPNGADGDQVFLLAGDGVILLYGTKQKESLKKLMDKAEKQCTELAAEYMRCLEDETLPLPEAMKFTFGPAPGWEKLPVLKYEEELAYEV